MPQHDQPVLLKWLNEKPALPVGVTWGVPWERGVLGRDEPLALTSETGQKIPVQSWPAAYWPDGSVKWTTHAAYLAGAALTRTYRLQKGEPALPERPLSVRETDERIEIDTGQLICSLNKSGPLIFGAIAMAGSKICSGGKLIGLLETVRREDGVELRREEPFEGHIAQIGIEQDGPLRAVVRVEGSHRCLADGRQWLPFILRCYFYAGLDSIRLVHTFIYDGDARRDYLKGLGLQFNVPLGGELYNRQIRLAGDSGLFGEVAQFLSPRYAGYAEAYPQQVAGRAVAPAAERGEGPADLVQDMAVWDSFKIVQDSADHYVIRKRTKPECCWIEAAHGRRSQGLAFLGGTRGGLAAVIRNFWQKYPSSLEIQRLSEPEACLRLWLWTPDAAAMDLRHYDTVTHPVSSYEGAAELRSTPDGIANTSEINLFGFDAMPAQPELLERAAVTQAPTLLVCRPEYYHAVKAFGVWSLSERAHPAKARLEEKLAALLDFYQREIEQRRWYGFWNFGDLMHSYDPVRHAWRYDVGGYAWQNTELVPNLWLWYSFLRTGDAALFRMAEAMTRHTSEVDLYHRGEYAGLGSRHNVLHWGCGCKEARIGMAGLHRCYYYLTGDERLGEIMDEVKDADAATVRLDPMRAYFSKDRFPTHVRSGPDWAAFCANWLTRWERHEDAFYRDKLRRGMASLKKMPFRLCSGPTFGYDPATGIFHYLGDENYSYHMVICFGAAEIWMELADLLQDDEWRAMLAEFGEFYSLDPAEKARRSGGGITGRDWSWPMFAGSLMAYAARYRNDPELAARAWRVLLAEESGFGTDESLRVETVATPGVIAKLNEIPGITTNCASMWSLRIIESLELIGDWIEP